MVRVIPPGALWGRRLQEALATFVLAAAACGDEQPAEPLPEPEPPGIGAVRVEVSPDPVRLRVGQSVSIALKGMDSVGRPAALGPIWLSSRDPAVATVTPTGVVTAVGLGETQLVVVWSRGTRYVEVEVPGSRWLPVDSILVAPGFTADFETVRLGGAEYDLGGQAVQTAVADSGVVSVRGVQVAGQRPGRTTLTVTWAAGSFSIPVRVVALPGTLAMIRGDGIWDYGRVLELQPLDGSPAATLTLPEPMWSPALSPDGGMIAGHRDVRGPRLAVVNLATMEVRPLPGTEDAYFDHAWSPDGRSLLYTGFTGWDAPLMVREASLEGASPRTVAWGGHARWVESGRLLAWECGVAPAADGGEGTCLAGPNNPTTATTYYGAYRPQPNPLTGELAMVRYALRHGAVVRAYIEVPGASLGPLPAQVTGLTWSPDGRWLAAASQGPAVPARVWIMSADGSALMWRADRASASWGTGRSASGPRGAPTRSGR